MGGLAYVPPKAPKQVIQHIRNRLPAFASTSNALAEVVHIFIDGGLVKDGLPKAVYFVRATYFYAYSLIVTSFNFDIAHIRSNPRVSELLPELDDLLRPTEKVSRSLERRRRVLKDAIMGGWDKSSLDLTTLPSEALVPTASPYQLLRLRCLCSDPRVSELPLSIWHYSPGIIVEEFINLGLGA